MGTHSLLQARLVQQQKACTMGPVSEQLLPGASVLPPPKDRLTSEALSAVARWTSSWLPPWSTGLQWGQWLSQQAQTWRGQMAYCDPCWLPWLRDGRGPCLLISVMR